MCSKSSTVFPFRFGDETLAYLDVKEEIIHEYIVVWKSAQYP